jgi:hypothetical protein
MGGVEPENFFSILKRRVVGASSIFALRLRDKSYTERAGDILKGRPPPDLIGGLVSSPPKYLLRVRALASRASAGLTSAWRAAITRQKRVARSCGRSRRQ